MIVREATYGDLPSLARVHVDTWRTTYQGLIPGEYLANLSYEIREQIWHPILNNPAYFIVVAEDQSGQIIGFASDGAERTGDRIYRGELTAIYILQHCQQSGIGRELVQAVAQRLVQREIQSMLVWVLAANPACRFYEKLGGQRLHEQEIAIGGTRLVEVAYGWTNMSLLYLSE